MHLDKYNWFFSYPRYFLMGWALYGMCGFDGDKDIVYTTLPLYHSSANGLVTGSVMVGGSV